MRDKPLFAPLAKSIWQQTAERIAAKARAGNPQPLVAMTVGELRKQGVTIAADVGTDQDDVLVAFRVLPDGTYEQVDVFT